MSDENDKLSWLDRIKVWLVMLVFWGVMLGFGFAFSSLVGAVWTPTFQQQLGIIFVLGALFALSSHDKIERLKSDVTRLTTELDVVRRSQRALESRLAEEQYRRMTGEH